MKTKEEIFAEALADAGEGDSLQWCLGSDFKAIASDITGYDEGNVSERCVYEYIPEGRFFAFESTTNSWDDWDGYEPMTLDDITEVFPVEKTIIVYE